MAFAFYSLVTLVGDSAPTAVLRGVFDPFHRGEVVIIFLHGDDPVDIIECDSFKSEVCVEIS